MGRTPLHPAAVQQARTSLECMEGKRPRSSWNRREGPVIPPPLIRFKPILLRSSASNIGGRADSKRSKRLESTKTNDIKELAQLHTVRPTNG